MTIQKMKETTFNPATITDWEQAAIKTLKNKPFESLSTKTLEDIILKPLYTLADLTNIPSNQTSIIRDSKSSSDWRIAQAVTGNTSKEILEDLKESISKGNEIIFFTVDTQHSWEGSEHIEYLT